jgi:hypothetical protein
VLVEAFLSSLVSSSLSWRWSMPQFVLAHLEMTSQRHLSLLYVENVPCNSLPIQTPKMSGSAKKKLLATAAKAAEGDESDGEDLVELDADEESSSSSSSEDEGVNYNYSFFHFTFALV